MAQKFDIEYTESFDKTTENLINHLSYYYSTEVEVINKIEKIIDSFEKRVEESPESCQISPSLMQELGIKTWREYNQNGIRILYRIMKDDKKVIADAFLSQKQDMEKALTDYCLIHI